MKKILLMGALGVFALGMQAQSFSDLYKVTFNGQPVEDGQTIVISDADYDEEWGDYSYEAVVYVENKENEIRALKGGLYTVEPEGYDDFVSQFGKISFCYANSPVIGGQCIMRHPGAMANVIAEGLVNVGAAGWTDPMYGEPFCWQIHVTEVADADLVGKVSLELKAYDGDINNAEALEESMTIYIQFGGEDNSVDTLNAASGAAEYFSLDGRRLQGPTTGLYIVKENGKVSKKLAL